MTENRVGFNFQSDLPGNQMAVAVGNNNEEDHFISKNQLFSMMFKDIHTPKELHYSVTNKSENKSVLAFNDSYWELWEFPVNPGETLYILKNIAFEMLALTQLKMKLKELSQSHELHSSILGRELPVGIMVTDKDNNVSFANQTLKLLFRIPPKLTLKKCYNYVKGIKPCDGCILKSTQTDKRKNKKVFPLDNGNRMVTAEIHPLGDKYMMIFRETTREIGLIREIQKQQEALESANKRIARQNDILRRLSNINIRISQMRDLGAILETVLTSIMGTFESKKAAFLLFKVGGKLRNAHFTDTIDEAERKHIIDAATESPEQLQDETILKEYIIQEIFEKERLIGRIFLYQPRQTVDTTILELFLMQVSSYLENLQLQRELEELVQTDGLTGVFNRYYYDKVFAEERELSIKFHKPMALILMDVNGLKQLNDEVGHEAGDTLIAQTAQLLSANLETYDTIFRIGGDEFVVLLTDCDKERLEQAVALLKNIQKGAEFEYKEKNYPLHFSLGGVCSTEMEHDNLKDEADKRMYTDKENYYKTHKKYR